MSILCDGRKLRHVMFRSCESGISVSCGTSTCINISEKHKSSQSWDKDPHPDRENNGKNPGSRLAFTKR